MLCPYCKSNDISVLDSRDVDNDSIRRRRQCENCNRRFTTYEKAEAYNVNVIKRDGRREPFDKNKLTLGIAKACEKRPVSSGQIESVADKIERKIKDSNKKEIKTADLGDMVMRELFKVDQVAYIRFASVYKQFDSPAEFIKVVSIFRDSKKKKK